MLNALLFDMGGTLDGDGIHWLDRFDGAYAAAGIALPRDLLKRAFDEAERRAARDETIATADLTAMVDRHVGWQIEELRASRAASREYADTEDIRAAVVRSFVHPIKQTAAVNRQLLTALRAQGYVLGVVSNGCGNVDALCEDLGYTPSLSLIVDSRRVGLFKPDPAIYLYAAARLGLPPSAIMMIGDSFDRDIRPAASVGMRTAWLKGESQRECPDPSLVDACLATLGELPGALDSRARTVA